VLASVAAVTLIGIGGSLIYALQMRPGGKDGEELYSTGNRQSADGLAGLPRDYTGPVLGPPLPGGNRQAAIELGQRLAQPAAGLIQLRQLERDIGLQGRRDRSPRSALQQAT
jgi:hypothetical protein